jgi:hypothetical protein
MAKKKTTPTPKDDLIDSILNDVQEMSDQEPKHERNASADLFLDDYEDDLSPKLVGLDNDENRHDATNVGAAHLWQEVKEAAPMKPDTRTGEKFVAPVYKGSAPADESFEPYDLPIEPELVPTPVATVEPVAITDDKTININEYVKTPATPIASEDSSILRPPQDSLDAERTIAVEGFANRQPRSQGEVSPKISFGSLRGGRPGTGGSVYASSDATLAQAESLKLAQQRILELEKEVEKYRQENEELASAGDIIRQRSEELTSRIFKVEGEKQEVMDQLQNELMIMKGSLQYKDTELNKARLTIEELEARLKSDFKKIRVRERELENRLELVKAEKSALLRAKDENILELKRKIDHLESELDNYRRKVLELNKTLDTNQEQFKRTVRALRLALSNLEVKEENVVPLKKAD